MEFRLELVQGVQVLNSSAGKPIPLRSYKGILSALGYSDKPLSREEIIASVWPQVPLQVGRNRLRVALVKLRSLMLGAIVEDEGGLSFDRGAVWIDAAEIRLALEKSQDYVTTSGELDALTAALAQVGNGSSFDQQAPGASGFGELVARACLRASELAAELSQVEPAKEAAKTATYFDPDSVAAWSAYLLACWRIGSAQSAIEDAKVRAPKWVQAEQKFQDALKQVRSKQPGTPERIANDRRGFWIEILHALEESRPDLMRSILSAPQTLSLSGRQPRTMHDLLQQATPLDIEDKDPIWERSAGRMIGLKAWLGDAQGVLASAPAVLESSQDPQIQRAVWNAVAVAHSLNGDWEQAYAALDRTMEYARQCGSEMYELTTRGNAAYFKMRQARFEESIADYDAIGTRLAEIDTPQAHFETAILLGNRALAPVFQGRWEEALAQLERGIDARTQGGLLLQMGMLQASLALVHASLGRLESVVNLTRLAFLDAFGSDSFRTQQFTFEIAAATISALGDPSFARSLVDWTDRWRLQTDAPRSEAEKLLVSRIPEVSQSQTLSGEPPSVGNEAMRRLRTLVSQSPSLFTVFNAAPSTS